MNNIISIHTIIYCQLYNILQMRDIRRHLVMLFLFFGIGLGYIDIHFHYQQGQQHSNYSIQAIIGQNNHKVPLTFHNNNNKTPINIQSSSLSTPQNLYMAQIEVSSIEKGGFEGWKRYIQQIVFYKQSIYHHNITVNLQKTAQTNSSSQLSAQNVFTSGPYLILNSFFNQMKVNSSFIYRNVIGLYHDYEGKGRMQLGGYEQNYAKVNLHDGQLFQKTPFTIKERAGQAYFSIVVPFLNLRYFDMTKFQQSSLSTTPSTFILSSQSRQLQLPSSSIATLIQILNKNKCQCSAPHNQSKYLICNNFNDIRTSLTYISLKFNHHKHINISMHLLIKDITFNVTTFYISQATDSSAMVIGTILFRDQYLVFDIDNSQILYSPVNRTQNPLNSVFIARFVLYFILFMMILSFATFIHQFFFNTSKKNQISFGSQGIQISTYERPITVQYQ